MRILALDWGTVRIGAAITDEDQRIAFPLDKTIAASEYVAEIKQLVLEKGVGMILLGFPLNLQGDQGSSAEKVKQFAREINRETGVAVELVDERFTSEAAGNLLEDQGLNGKQQREIKDNIAAQLMLQQYIDTRNNNKIKP
ncbi:MAG: Holliday junction resolvase RuvX [Candidatus Saccharibacteria bacterium]